MTDKFKNDIERNLPTENGKVVKLHTRTRRKKRARKIWARVFALLLFMLVFATVFMLNSELFEIKGVDVTGMERVPRKEIEAASGIRTGENMLSFRAGGVAEAIKKNPLVTDVIVSRKLPSKVRIVVRERRPFGYVHVGKTFYMIDAEMIVIEIGKRAINRGILMLMTDQIEPVRIGQKIKFPYSDLMHSFINRASASLGDTLTAVHFNSAGIKVDLANGAYVLLGNGEQFEEKLDLIPLLVRSLDNANAPYAGINLRNIDIPTFIKRKSAPNPGEQPEPGEEVKKG
jgi:cell division septal protein FtsQ